VYAFDPYGPVTDVDDDIPPKVPRTFTVSQNYPNPFNPSTVIEYNLPYRSMVNVTVLNVLGQRVATLVSDRQTAGPHQVTWDGRNSGGDEVASGIYFYRITFDNSARTKKMVLMK
jgi:hypothetical protein